MRIWIPLQQPVRPLAVLDKRTFDRERDQVAYRFSVPFLKRDGIFDKSLSEAKKKELKYNDTWRVAHNADQQWYFTSEMNSKRGYCFQIPSCAHTAFSLPGEDVAQQLYMF